ncbi:MAG: hypothetical protein IPG74_09555 [Flavobacteriales bacterium]|nr:hypothetical protein [Flavobacteriales bacterium]
MFHQPKSLTVDSAGVIYVADYENHRIRKSGEGGVVTTVAGDGNAGDGIGPTFNASFNVQRDPCLDDAGNLYFVDLMNHRIKVLTTAGDVELVAGSGTQGNADGIGALAEFQYSGGIDWESPGTLMVLDAVDPLLRRVTTAGVVTTVAGSGGTGYVDGNSTLAEFDLPQDICFNNYGELFVGDRNNNAIRILYPHGEKPMTVDEPAPAGQEVSVEVLAVHPNPTSSHTTIDLSHIPDPLTGLLIYDEKGALVVRKEQGDLAGFGRGAATIDATGWPAGQYAVLVSTRSRLDPIGVQGRGATPHPGLRPEEEGHVAAHLQLAVLEPSCSRTLPFLGSRMVPSSHSSPSFSCCGRCPCRSPSCWKRSSLGSCALCRRVLFFAGFTEQLHHPCRTKPRCFPAISTMLFFLPVSSSMVTQRP